VARPYNRGVMEITDLQVILAAAILTAAALLFVFDRLRKDRHLPQMQRIQTRFTSRPQSRTAIRFNPATSEYAPARRAAAEQRREPAAVATAVVSEPPAPPPPKRETVTIEFTTLLEPPNQAEDRVPQEQAGKTSLESTPLPAFTIDAELWERLIASMPSHDLLTEGAPSRPQIDVAPGALTADYQLIENESDAIWPKGVIQQSVFQNLLASGESFGGLVISIGVNDDGANTRHSQGLMHSVGDYLGGLLRANDFSCRSGYDEFIVVCPGETGAEAQRRLSNISERLWDYQLRGISNCSILFSWGGVQVQDQPLAEAVASAVDRMRQTRRLSTAGALTRVQRTAV
jgi:hypothetical protein